MKVKVSDFIADFFAENGIRTIFTVVGGGAMHMNDSFGHHDKLTCIYNHHEQASAMAAEAYFRVNNEMAGLCVTSGPGAINALNGVAGAYQDSIPMLVVSGQTKSTLMVRQSGLPLRTLGNQEFDIISTLDNITKYAETVMKPEKIRYCLEKAFYIAKEGRPGPCWLEVPVDVQGAFVETEDLEGYSSGKDTDAEKKYKCDINEQLEVVVSRLKTAKRPVLYVGNGIRISGGKDKLDSLVAMTGIPVVTCWNSIDLQETDSIYYAGRGGIMGDRSGNFAVQNSDLLIAIGTRLNIYQVGYQIQTWARGAYVVAVDIDSVELQKPTIRVDLPICCDATWFMDCLMNKIAEEKNVTKDTYVPWVEQCGVWKNKYPVVQEKHYEETSPLNVYAAMNELSKSLPEGMITVVANGSASVVGSAVYFIKKNQRFLMNCAISSMGYDLPAAIGACVANYRQPMLCLAGDGSIMMNLQELQTIVTNRLPIKVVLINNEGYHQIRVTQTNLFQSNYVGIGSQSGDLDFPDFEKIAVAFGFPYKKCGALDDLPAALKWLAEESSFCFLEIFCSTKQAFEPKSATKKMEDGSLYSPPLEDLAPFLPREELEENMYIPLWEER